VDLNAGAYRIGFWNGANREIWKTDSGPDTSLSLTGAIAVGATYVLQEASASTPSYTNGHQTFTAGFRYCWTHPAMA
jgi:hypothetical protein